MVISGIAAALSAASTAATAAFAGISASTISGAAAIGGLALGGAGLAMNVSGQQQAAGAARKAEDLRERQAELTALRERREIVRRAQAARSIALSNATSAGAESSSVLPGAYGQSTGEAARLTLASMENLEIGRGIFDANRDIASGRTLAGIGAGLTDFGRGMMTVSPEIGRIGSTIFGAPGASGNWNSFVTPAGVGNQNAPGGTWPYQ